ncbi:MAG: hypothetical protein N4A38_06165 [Candidatus Gracilibacteria bacterium]|nr:hypothetical protein [Candidatus Gracilibacteria bacterium]
MKKFLLIIFFIFCVLFNRLFFSTNIFADNNADNNVEKNDRIPEEKIQEKIEENNKALRQKLEQAIENKLNFIEISQKYKELDEVSKIAFYEAQLKIAEKKLEQTKKEKEIEIYEIFIEKVKQRLQKLYGKKIEDEEVILEILNIK